MTTFAGTFTLFDNFLLRLAKKEIDLLNDALVMGLSTSGYVPDEASHSVIGDISNELSGNGYSRKTLASKTLNLSSGVVTLDAQDVEFVASGGSLTARYWWLFDDTHASDALIGFGLLDATTADVVAEDGLPIRVKFNATGIVRLS